MKHALPILSTLAASPALAHSGAHIHPHEAVTWIAVILAAMTVGGTMTLVHIRRRK
ncbi:hypothetical protein QEZ52_21795 (plasmid) [Aliisedimentitalea scapharcae]|uniref:Peptidase M23 n=1 Tax=Aliisedimentitalea scapharcae TaxID=1524259 RepID=A0ABZ2XYK9_9RHOB